MNKDRANKQLIIQKMRTMGFTFVEAIAALAIVSICLLALIRLQIISINMSDAAQVTSQAVLLANEKIEQILAASYPEQKADSGTVERNSMRLHWQSKVTDLQPLELRETEVSGLRKILVDVSWEQGTGRKHLQMSTYVADRKLK